MNTCRHAGICPPGALQGLGDESFSGRRGRRRRTQPITRHLAGHDTSPGRILMERPAVWLLSSVRVGSLSGADLEPVLGLKPAVACWPRRCKHEADSACAHAGAALRQYLAASAPSPNSGSPHKGARNDSMSLWCWTSHLVFWFPIYGHWSGPVSSKSSQFPGLGRPPVPGAEHPSRH